MNACTTVGSVWPTFSVPGMTGPGPGFRNRNKRRRRRERSDAERVEEVGDGADRDLGKGGSLFGLRPADDEAGSEQAERCQGVP